MGISDFFKGLIKEIKDNRIENNRNQLGPTNTLTKLLEIIKLSPEKLKIKVELIKEFEGWYQTQNGFSITENKKVEDYDYDNFYQNCLDLNSTDKSWYKFYIKKPPYDNNKKTFFGKYFCVFNGTIFAENNKSSLILTIEKLVEQGEDNINTLYTSLYEKGEELYGVPECGESLEESINLKFDEINYKVFEDRDQKNSITFDDYKQSFRAEWNMKIFRESVFLKYSFEGARNMFDKTILMNIQHENIELFKKTFIIHGDYFINNPTQKTLQTIYYNLETISRSQKRREAIIPCNFQEFEWIVCNFIEKLDSFRKEENITNLKTHNKKTLSEEVRSHVNLLVGVLLVKMEDRGCIST